MRVKLKGFAASAARARTDYYAWRGGPRLVGTPGTPEFIASYAAALLPAGTARGPGSFRHC